MQSKDQHTAWFNALSLPPSGQSSRAVGLKVLALSLGLIAGCGKEESSKNDAKAPTTPAATAKEDSLAALQVPSKPGAKSDGIDANLPKAPVVPQPKESDPAAGSKTAPKPTTPPASKPAAVPPVPMPPPPTAPKGFETYSLSELRALTPDEISKLDVERFKLIASNQISLLSRRQLLGLYAAFVSEEKRPNTTEAEKQALRDFRVNKLALLIQLVREERTPLTALEVSRLAPERISASTLERIRPQEIRALAFEGLRPEVFGTFSAEQIAGLSGDQLAKITALQLSYLSKVQREAFSYQQLQAIPANVLALNRELSEVFESRLAQNEAVVANLGAQINADIVRGEKALKSKDLHDLVANGYLPAPTIHLDRLNPQTKADLLKIHGEWEKRNNTIRDLYRRHNADSTKKHVLEYPVAVQEHLLKLLVERHAIQLELFGLIEQVEAQAQKAGSTIIENWYPAHIPEVGFRDGKQAYDPSRYIFFPLP